MVGLWALKIVTLAGQMCDKCGTDGLRDVH